MPGKHWQCVQACCAISAAICSCQHSSRHVAGSAVFVATALVVDPHSKARGWGCGTAVWCICVPKGLLANEEQHASDQHSCSLRMIKQSTVQCTCTAANSGICAAAGEDVTMVDNSHMLNLTAFLSLLLEPRYHTVPLHKAMNEQGTSSWILAFMQLEADINAA